jgi:hypothetical protein
VEKPPILGIEAFCLVGATPAGTEDASLIYRRPILWRVQVALNRRNARKAVGCFYSLRYVLTPREIVLFYQGPKAKVGGVSLEMIFWPDTVRIDRLRALS